MKLITKNNSPNSLDSWKKSHPQGCYSDLDVSIRQEIRNAALNEQFYLCAYCCVALTGNNDCHNEHILAKSIYPKNDLDYSNIVASCNNFKQCGIAHKNQILPLTPLMNECEIELEFSISGRVKGLTPRANATIKILNLGDSERNNRALVEKRKQLADAILWKNLINPEEGLDDEKLYHDYIQIISTPENGKLDSFAPVVVNILKGWLNSLETKNQLA